MNDTTTTTGGGTEASLARLRDLYVAARPGDTMNADADRHTLLVADVGAALARITALRRALNAADAMNAAHQRTIARLHALLEQAAPPVEPEPVCGFRVGDRVEITGRGDLYDGRTGRVASIDDTPAGRGALTVEFPLAVDGVPGRVRCAPGQLRHAAPVETAGSAT